MDLKRSVSSAAPRFQAKPVRSERQATPMIVTIDGPAGVGKSTVAKMLAQRVGLTYLDTGATYRALAYAAVQQHLNTITDAERLSRLARHLPLELRSLPDGRLQVLLDHVDITSRIRTEEVSEAAAQVSQYPKVRAAMVKLQRKIADAHGVVVEGRDTGSVVFPHATHKFFLDAALAIRAKRRRRELSDLYGAASPIVQVREQIHFRDSLDRSRRVGPLVKPPGAVAIDTSRLSATQVVRKILQHLRASAGSCGSPHACAR